MPNSIYALILAGGSGERFWPLSRRARPKQLLRLVSELTLLEETVSRLSGLVPQERILILTNVDQEAAVRELMPKLSEREYCGGTGRNATRRRPLRSGRAGSRARDHSADDARASG